MHVGIILNGELFKGRAAVAGGQGAHRWPQASGKLRTSPAALPWSPVSVGFWASCGGAAAPSPAGPCLEPSAEVHAGNGTAAVG